MDDDGRELNWADLEGKNIKMRWTEPVLIYKRSGYFPTEFTTIAPKLDIGYFSGLYFNQQTQRYMIEMIDGEAVEEYGRRVLYTYENQTIDWDYVRKQYFNQTVDSSGWFGGKLDGDITKLPSVLSNKLANVIGTTKTNVVNGVKFLGVSFIVIAGGLGYLYYKSHQTNVNINLKE